MTKEEWEVHHAAWRRIWRCAFQNMPHKRTVKQVTEWTDAKGVTVPDFIRMRANDKARTSMRGVEVIKTYDKEYIYGQHALLARLMGYSSKQLWGCLNNGSKPRDSGKAALAKRLAGNDGRTLAIEIMKSRGIDLSKYVL